MITVQNQPFVLLIDPDFNRLAATSELLCLPETQLLRAGKAQEGFEKAKRTRPLLIVSQKDLPDASGAELCRMVRTDEDLSGTHFILIGDSNSDSGGVFESFQAGADDYIETPFDGQYRG
jgi:DNA-binding response OmpR family regulator